MVYHLSPVYDDGGDHAPIFPPGHKKIQRRAETQKVETQIIPFCGRQGSTQTWFRLQLFED